MLFISSVSNYVFLMHDVFRLPDWWSGALYPQTNAVLTQPECVASQLWLGGDVMSKAYAKKHRAVSFVTDINTQSPEEQSSGDFLYGDKAWTQNKRAKVTKSGRGIFFQSP